MSEKPESLFLRYAEPFLATGFCTHLYAECGFLDERDPVFRFVHEAPSADEFHARQDIFDLASLTKALVATPLAFACIHAKGASFSTTVGDLLGRAAQRLPRALAELTVDELLAHRSGLPPWRNFWINRLEPESKASELGASRLSHIETVFNRQSQLIFTRGSDVYSDCGFILLGYLLESLAGVDLASQWRTLCDQHGLTPAAAGDWVGFPLGQKAIEQRAIPTAYCAIRERWLAGEVHDENAAALGGVAGHAGLFGTGPGLSHFLKAFANSTVGREVIEANARRVTAPTNSALLGWRQADDASSEVFGGGRAIGHMGFTGTAFWVNPSRSSYAILLSNRTIGGRVSPRTKTFRREGFELLQGFLDQTARAKQ